MTKNSHFNFQFYDFWEMNISMLLSLAQKFRKIAVGVFCESLRAQDLDIIREVTFKFAKFKF